MSLTPGERVDMKMRIARTLGEQSWANIDLTLEEFGFKPFEYDGDNRQSYATAVLRYANDDSGLAQLDRYLHPADPRPEDETPEFFEEPLSPWAGDRFKLFISHVHDKADVAGKLREQLAARHVDAFVAHDSIDPTEEWREVILYALATCDACAALLSPGFKESEWTDQELGFIMARDKLIIPLEFGVVPYGFLGRYQSLKITGEQPFGVALSIFELLVRKEQSCAAMARVLVSRFAASGSFQGTRELYSALKKIPEQAWTQDLVTQAWMGWKENLEIYEAGIEWKDAEQALEELFRELPYQRPT